MVLVVDFGNDRAGDSEAGGIGSLSTLVVVMHMAIWIVPVVDCFCL